MLKTTKMKWRLSLSSRVGIRPIVVAVILAALTASSGLAQDILQPGAQPPASSSQPAANPTQFIVQFTQGTPRSTRVQIVQQAGASVRNDLSIINAVTVRVPNQQVLNALSNNLNVMRVVPDRRLREAMPAPQTPPTPTDLVAVGFSSSQIDLAWNQGTNSGEEGFRIERCPGSGCANFNALAAVGANVTSYSDTGLGPDETYTYRVIAFITSGSPSGRDSAPSNSADATTDTAGEPLETPPAAPSNLSAAAVSLNEIGLTWMDNSADEDEFIIERCEGSGCSGFLQIATVAANTQAYSDTGLTALTTYRYRVQASNTAGPSSYSNEDEATTPDNPPSPITFGGTRQIIPGAVQRVGPPDAYSDGTGVGVAVLDSGCDFNHRDLACTAMIDYFGGTGQDNRGHGTHVIGLINAQNNNFDIVGVAPGSSVYSYKSLGADGNGDESNFVNAINDIVSKPGQFPVPVGVINISAGRPLAVGELMEDTPMCQAAAVARDSGIVVVVSAGNSPDLEISDLTPAGCSAVIPVAATVATDGISTCPIEEPTTVVADTATNYTTDGPGVISAPGSERDDFLTNGFSCTGYLYGTLSTTWGGAQGLNPNDPNDPVGATRKIPIPLEFGGAIEARGTSFAAPLVAGIAARMKQVGMGGGTGDAAEVDAIRNEIFNTADRASANPNDPDAAPVRHAWADLTVPLFNQTDDGVKEGIAQAPSAP
jgi:subtilisin family serine protease